MALDVNGIADLLISFITVVAMLAFLAISLKIVEIVKR